MSNVYVFFALLWRDLKEIKSRLVGNFIDNIFLLTTSLLVFGSFLPLMGMSSTLIAPLFIGNIILIVFELGYTFSIKIVNDVKFDRFIDYHFSLPLSSTWLLVEYITKFVIEVAIITLPILVLGIFLLGNKFIIVHTNWFAFGIMYMLMLIFFATLFLYYSFAYSYEWFFSCIWTRRLDPLFLFGCVFLVWKKLYAFSRPIGIAFLFNPVTYMAEGIRATLIGGDGFLPIWACMLGVTIGIVINWLLLVPAMRKKLDHI